MQTACLVIAIVSGIAMLFYGFITNHTVRGLYRIGTLAVCFISTTLALPNNLSRLEFNVILISGFILLITGSTGIAKYLDDKREAKESEGDE